MPQSLTNLLIHLIFSTKDRQPFFSDPQLLVELHHYLGGIVNHHGGNSIIAGGVADHVHLLLVLPRTLTTSDLVRDLKRASSLWLKSRHADLKDFSWQGGYGAFSVGQGEIEVVRTYIANQAEHHRKRSFQEEYRTFLEKYGISYDERYVWD
ncbi:IS200/IS605 family transposase [Luteolibacter sp. GHJ8]|uniref:IS200/IS605 family transposase n=1 Tax=Luteolibacter rhizosphaerae TaxID=2989719 RepID=A0ABT3G0W9_9BACT|nr:IS200/IS605 family transposase [Luteolibacter rhizosphaerae]MCW1913171.1 IS200/IS605 family transposase [Luteolibacter rhizosphaerae]